MPRSRRIALLATGIAGAAGLTGCWGGGSPAGLDASALKQTAQTTEAAGGARMELSAHFAGQTLHGAGVLDMKHDAYSMSIQLGAAGKSQVVLIGKRLYLTLPTLQRNGALAGKWSGAVDLAKAAKPRGSDLSQLAPWTAPGSMLEQLRAVADVKRVGADTVRGVPTTHFRATVDLHKAAALLPPARRAQMHPQIDQLVLQAGQSTVPVEAWVDGQQRLRRESVTLGNLGTMRLDLYDFGKQRRVVAPPADQVVGR
jgi:hypothetical protein